MQMNIPSPVGYVINKLTSAGYHAYCVGGCVRDHLMGRLPGDYDVTTSAKPDEMLCVFADCRVVETGLKHGTVTVVLDGMNIEVTTYRIDGTYDDGRHPDSVTFTDKLSDDLCRRDFTINAMAYSPEGQYGDGQYASGRIVDLFGGAEDLANRVIRCVGRAEERFSEDGLRIMRALRFSAVLDFTPDDECSAAVRKLTHLLDRISRERIYAELTKLITGKGAARIMKEYPDVISHVLPGTSPDDILSAARAIEREREIYPAPSPDTAMRYAMIFDSLDTKAARAAIASLKMSRDESCAIMIYRNDCPPPDEFEIKKLMSRTDDKTPSNLAHLSCIMGRISPQTAEKITEITQMIIEKDLPRKLSMLPVSGNDLIACGFKGREIGLALDGILEAVMRGELANERECILASLKAPR